MNRARFVIRRRHKPPPAAAEALAHAPEALRRRVMATVRSQPEPTTAGLRRRLERRALRPLLAGALLCGAVLVVVLAIDASQHPSASLGRARVSAEYSNAHATLRRVGSHAELAITGMPQAPIGEVYQVWLVRPRAQPTPTDALFTVTEKGNGSVEVPGSLRGIREVMVTTEPVGGSVHPTSLAVLRVLLGRSSGN